MTSKCLKVDLSGKGIKDLEGIVSSIYDYEEIKEVINICNNLLKAGFI